MANQLYTPRNIFAAGQDSFARQMKNLQSIGESRRKLEKERDDLDFKKKEQNLKLEKMRREGRVSKIEADTLEAQHKQYLKQQNSILDGKDAEIGVVENETRQKADEARAQTQAAFKADPIGITEQVMQSRGQRTLRPKWSGGNLSYEVVDNEKENLERRELRADVATKEQKAKGGYTNKDVYDVAKSMAGEYPTAEKIRELMPEAARILNDDIKQPAPKRSVMDNAFATGSTVGGGSQDISPQQTKQFKNAKTGQVDTFKKVNGKWVKIDG